MNTKKLALAAIVTLPFLAACNVGNATDSVVLDPEPTATTASPETSLVEQAYIDTMRDRNHWDVATDEELIELGEATCEFLDSGATFAEVTDVMMSEGVSAYDAGYLYGAATAAFCPEYIDPGVPA